MSKYSDESAVPPPTWCRLLELPAELQVHIYEYAVVESQMICFNCPWHFADADRIITLEKGHNGRASCRHPTHASKTLPALAATSLYLRNMVLPIYYAKNEFQLYCDMFDNVDLLKAWLQSVQPRYRPLLKHAFVRTAEPI